MIKTPSNQPRVGRSGRGYVIAEAGAGGEEHGRGHHPIFWGCKLNKKNIYNNKCIAAFGGLQLNIITQQPTKNRRARGRKGWRRGTNVGEWQRDANAPHLRVEG